jgi:methionyl aminopeptidase
MITVKSPAELAKMAKASEVVVEALKAASDIVEPGVTTFVLDAEVRRVVEKHGCKPAFLGYRGFPAASCVSVNDEVVHGIPSDDRVLKEGDIVGIDVGVEYKGYFGDAAFTMPVGDVTPEVEALLKRGKFCLDEAVNKATDGNRLGDISNTIQTVAESGGYNVVRDFVGHGVGSSLHEEPQIPNFGPAGKGPRLKAGMTLALEPMLVIGDWRVKVLEDNWTVVTGDGTPAVHFEHTVVVGENEPEVLTIGWEEFMVPYFEPAVGSRKEEAI